MRKPLLLVLSVVLTILSENLFAVVPFLIEKRINIPGIKAQTTSLGKSIHTLFTYHDKVYIGYGDYGANTGPIAIVSYDINSGNFAAEYSAGTETIDRFYNFQGTLITMDIDPRGVPYGSIFIKDVNTGKWRAGADINDGTHTFDAVEHQGKLYAATGGWSAQISVSENIGASWKADLVIPTPNENQYHRFYYVGSDGEHLLASGYTHTVNTNGTSGPLMYIKHGANWNPVKGINSYYIPVNINDNFRLFGLNFVREFYSIVDDSLVKTGNYPELSEDIAPTDNDSVSFEKRAFLSNMFIKQMAPPEGEDTLFVMFSRYVDIISNNETTSCSLQDIWLTTDFETWTFITTLYDTSQNLLTAPDYNAISYHNGNIYLGSRSGDLYVLRDAIQLIEIVGCMDTLYQSYDSTATKHDPSYCKDPLHTVWNDSDKGLETSFTSLKNGLRIFIKGATSYSIKMYNLYGTLIHSESANQSGIHTIQNVPSGLYVVNFELFNKHRIIKIVIP
ncbi:MAG: T9SS type A sorting domain-containing protein [Fibrobacteria bacterium]|nr:T9SS type A sorting domain-containing protein [Fibrobacteria bacterium]